MGPHLSKENDTYGDKIPASGDSLRRVSGEKAMGVGSGGPASPRRTGYRERKHISSIRARLSLPGGGRLRGEPVVRPRIRVVRSASADAVDLPR